MIHNLRNKSHLEELLVCILATTLKLQRLSVRLVASRGLDPECVLSSFLHNAIRHVVHGYPLIAVYVRDLTDSGTTFSLSQLCNLINVIIHVGEVEGCPMSRLFHDVVTFRQLG